MPHDPIKLAMGKPEIRQSLERELADAMMKVFEKMPPGSTVCLTVVQNHIVAGVPPQMSRLTVSRSENFVDAVTNISLIQKPKVKNNGGE